MALNLTNGYAQAPIPVPVSGTPSFLFAVFRAADVEALQFIGLTNGREKGDGGRGGGWKIEGGNLVAYSDGGGETHSIIAEIAPGAWYAAMLVATGGSAFQAYLTDPVTPALSASWADPTSGYLNMLPTLSAGVKWRYDEPEYALPTGLSVAHLIYGTGTPTQAQREAIFAGTDPTTLAGLTIEAAHTCVGDGASLVDGDPALALSPQTGDPLVDTATFDAVDPLDGSAPASAPTFTAPVLTATTATFDLQYAGADADSYQIEFNGRTWSAALGTVELTNLVPDLDYTLRARAVNALGSGNWSVLNFSTTEAAAAAADTPISNNSATVAVKLASASANVVLVVSTASDLSTSPIRSDSVATDAQGAVKITVEGLLPNTQYYFGAEVDGVLEPEIGRFRTWGGPLASYRFATSGCANTNSNHAIFDHVRAVTPLFFIWNGDLHYRDIATNDVGLYRAGYDGALAAAKFAQFLRDVPIAYVWDDHDFGPDNSDGSHVGKAAALQAYQERVPHYELGGADGNYQSFVCGPIRYVLCDTRYNRDQTGSSPRPCIGATQESWLQGQIDAAASAGQCLCVVWSIPWVGSDSESTNLFAEERIRIADYIKAAGMTSKTFWLCGDMHSPGVYSPAHQSHGDYATGGGANMPVFHSSAIDRTPSTKGGPYWLGPTETLNNFATIDVTTLTGGGVRLDYIAWHLAAGVLTRTFVYSITLGAS